MKSFISFCLYKNKSIENALERIHSHYHSFSIDNSCIPYLQYTRQYNFQNKIDAYHFEKLLNINSIQYEKRVKNISLLTE
jgi:hypothetical protein